MRFFMTIFIAMLPAFAMAAEPATSEDIDDLYELMTEMAASNSCKATGKDNSNCSISCPDHERALCYGDDNTVAQCQCAVGSEPYRFDGKGSGAVTR